MSRSGVLRDVWTMRFEEVVGRHQAGGLSCEEAADILGMSESSFYRWRRRYEASGEAGLVDGRIGKANARRAPVDEVSRLLALYETEYFDFSVKHFHEKLADHGLHRSYSWTKNQLQQAGLVGKAGRRGEHRRKRPRKPMVGMMLHQDGSRHEWMPGQFLDLIVTMDDADGQILSAFFVEEEGTMSSFQAVFEVISRHGLFSSLYTDRGSHYWLASEAGGKVDKDNLTQFHRAMRQLNIRMIPAYSPEARGRSERMFETLQGRLPQELRRAGMTDKAAANRFLAEVFLPEHNRRFQVEPAESASAFTPYLGPDLNDVLCIQEERQVGNDNTVRYQRRILQIPADKHRHHYVKATVVVHEHIDGTLAVFHGPRCLARYDAQGQLQTAPYPVAA